jgi:16S rRNA (guanine527-N7)-methyltransferase
MTHESMAELLAPFLEGTSLTSHQLGLLSTHLDLLLKWNAKVNLTAVRVPEEIVTRHFGESLFVVRLLFPYKATAQSVVDIGSGAGFPGLPLKIWAPALDLTLVESNQRKAVFLREVVRALGLADVRVSAERAEKLSTRADLVTFRAVEHFEQVLPLADKLTKPGGRIAILIGSSQVETAISALEKVSWDPPVPIPLSQSRSLMVGHVRPPAMSNS